MVDGEGESHSKILEPTEEGGGMVDGEGESHSQILEPTEEGGGMVDGEGEVDEEGESRSQTLELTASEHASVTVSLEPYAITACHTVIQETSLTVCPIRSGTASFELSPTDRNTSRNKSSAGTESKSGNGMRTPSQNTSSRVTATPPSEHRVSLVSPLRCNKLIAEATKKFSLKRAHTFDASTAGHTHPLDGHAHLVERRGSAVGDLMSVARRERLMRQAQAAAKRTITEHNKQN